MAKRDFLTLLDLEPEALKAMLERAAAIKSAAPGDPAFQPLKNRSLAMLFEKPSTRTRLSFEVAMNQLGGNAIFLSRRDTQLGRGEPVADSARVLARMVDAIMIRNDSHEIQQTLASHAHVPVINGLSDLYHPCQVLADMLTLREHRGDIQGRTIAWIGDGNNMCHSYINGAVQFGYWLRIAAPPGYQPDPDIMARAGDRALACSSAEQAATGADLVVTDVWASMGQDQQRSRRLADFRDFQVHAGIMAAANPGALFMHCLPAHRGEEVTAEVIEGPKSVVWDEAGNRLHAQKALLECLLC